MSTATVAEPKPKPAPARPRTPKAPKKAPPAAEPAPGPKPSRKGSGPSKAVREAADLLKAASDPTRLRVLMLLEDGEQHVGALCEAVGQGQPAVSHHLALLRAARLVEVRRDGKFNRYALSEDGRKLAGAAGALV